ncbi:uncharacterized protein LOC113044075 [Carassius auratus]|uniref:Uncharacterized protein LOC113044075 n=1 Tax=Carassius auratus TaxID=7957 RepID=A0A6P6JIJ7_CARAU|nr:uncharacterized protein LOC113044075 [Carassius auratus]
MVRTLYNLSDLRETRFGQPSPRHGLSLLWWFAHNCVQIDSNSRMTALYNPEYGAFGFDLFYNRERLLPYSNRPYYEVGNLNNPGSLPHYVTKKYTGYSDDSNKDRIIVSFNSRWNRFEKIYVTQHSDEVHFDQNHTYRISPKLLEDIQELNLKKFLRKTINNSYQISYQMHCTPCPSPAPSVKTESNQRQGSKSVKGVCAESCEVLFCIIIIIIIIIFLFMLFISFSKMKI